MTTLGVKRPAERALSHMWHMGGRIFDLSTDQLDRLTRLRLAAVWRPPAVDRAQELVDSRVVSR